jgi:hypothetical protein
VLRAFFRARRRVRASPQDPAGLSSGAAADGV